MDGSAMAGLLAELRGGHWFDASTRLVVQPPPGPAPPPRLLSSHYPSILLRLRGTRGPGCACMVLCGMRY
eukprot:3250940-Rhodomonas_salina.1